MNDEVKRAINPLRMLFWGALLCIFDITFSTTTNGQGFKLDILNDAVGMILITVGVYRLSGLQVSERYANAMKFVLLISVLSVLDAIREHLILRLSPAADFGIEVFGFVSLVAMVVFCVAMRWFCEHAGLTHAAKSWSVTTRLFVIIYLIPLGLLYLAGGLASLAGETFHFDLGPAGLILFAAFIIPPVHLFVSTSRMKRAAEWL